MHYCIGDFTLHPLTNKVVIGNEDKPIRQKTLQLLVYLLEHQDAIHSKQQLLDAIWQSAGAQEHVLFQSINEIRAIFKPLEVVKTFPRQGYQWIYPYSKVETVTKTSHEIPTQKKNRYAIFALLTICLAVFSALFLSSWQVDRQQPNDTAGSALNSPIMSRELVVLPVENTVSDKSLAWVRLGGMDIMIKQLQAQNKFAVLDVEDVMMTLARGNSFDLNNVEQQARMIRTNVGEAVTLQTKLLGAPMQYQLHYRLVGRYQQKQNIIYADTVDQLWPQLVTQILHHYQEPQTATDFNEQYADHHLLQAMEHFHRQDFDKAEQYFNVLHDQRPSSVIAMRYLVKLLRFRSAYEQAEELASKALIEAERQGKMREYSRIVFQQGVIASSQLQFEKANKYFEQSRALADKYGDKLYVAFSHTEIARLLAIKGYYSQAEALYLEALKYHESFRCPYGQVANLHALAELQWQVKDKLQTNDYFVEAMAVAKQNNLKVEQVFLLLSLKTHTVTQEDKQQITDTINALIETLPNDNIRKYLTGILENKQV